MPFDSAGCSNLDNRTDEMLVMGADLFQEDAGIMTKWQAVNRADPVLMRSLSKPKHATSFHMPTMIASVEDTGMKQYLRHIPHRKNGLVIVAPAPTANHWDGIGFYRAESDEQFSRRDMQLAEVLSPHLLQAIKINLRVAGAVESTAGPTPAIARMNGQLLYAAPGLAALLRLEWPDWSGYLLPPEMMVTLGTSTPFQFTGKRIEASAQLFGGLLMLQVRTVSALAKLSDREATTARLYGAGLSTKEIARCMGIAPNTVRNFVQRIYQKLEVNDKAALAVLLGADVRIR
jgi:DNA-binding CsgD family transcriptional regulator